MNKLPTKTEITKIDSRINFRSLYRSIEVKKLN